MEGKVWPGTTLQTNLGYWNIFAKRDRWPRKRLSRLGYVCMTTEIRGLFEVSLFEAIRVFAAHAAGHGIRTNERQVSRMLVSEIEKGTVLIGLSHTPTSPCAAQRGASRL